MPLVGHVLVLGDWMEFCLVCKEITGRRYKVKVSDTEHDNRVDGYVCADCWASFISSLHNERPFRVMKWRSWIKGDKDGKRM